MGFCLFGFLIINFSLKIFLRMLNKFLRMCYKNIFFQSNIFFFFSIHFTLIFIDKFLYQNLFFFIKVNIKINLTINIYILNKLIKNMMNNSKNEH